MFRLLANPTEKTKRLTQREQEEDRPPRDKSRRVCYRGEELQLAWLERKAEQAGFRVDSIMATSAGIIRAYRTRAPDEKPMVFYGVRFDGVLQVVAPELLVKAVEQGIGSAKGFGFGLLSIARCN